jgi:hypothetical protein
MFGRRKERKTPFVMEPRADLEDLRDDTIALFLNSGLSFQQVHANGGPTGPTVSKWLYKETRFPRLDTMRALVKAVGGDIVIVGAKTAESLQGRTPANRLNVAAAVAQQTMDTAAHRKRQKQHRIHRNRSAHRKSANGTAR